MIAEMIPERALSVRQPWAQAIVLGLKDVENRSRLLVSELALPIRIAVHASATFEAGAIRQMRHALLVDDDQAGLLVGAPLSAIIGVVTIVGVDRPLTIDQVAPTIDRMSPWWNWDSFGYRLVDPIRFDEPIPSSGMLGLWRLTELHRLKIEDQLRRLK